MPAYARYRLAEITCLDPHLIVGRLETAYARDGYASQLAQQTITWDRFIPALLAQLRTVLKQRPDSAEWGVLLEYPLYRLGRRLDLVILAGPTVLVVELKVGATRFFASDRRQVEEYALDLRDFHAESAARPINPVLWATGAADSEPSIALPLARPGTVADVLEIGISGLVPLLLSLPMTAAGEVQAHEWDNSPYRPVPNVIQAATSIYAGHDVRAITQADASNLKETTERAIELLQEANNERCYALIFVTGVPGSGKTLAGLQIVHDAVATGAEARGNIVYLSGNTPLVTVLREALAKSEYEKAKSNGHPAKLDSLRQKMRTRIQHLNDFLNHSYRHATNNPPHEHAIIFDEAQRAWDEKQGKAKFDRAASEPTLILEVMSRHQDWCACICLIGGGQEINSGEFGVRGWGDALRRIKPEQATRWRVYGPPELFHGGASSGGLTLGEIPELIKSRCEPDLMLSVPLRSYRAPVLAKWVDAVLEGDSVGAAALKAEMGEYPVLLTRELNVLRRTLLELTRGERRCGLVASSGARRLRAEGIGVMLHANDGKGIADWYLKPRGDVRASYALEVAANEYTSQGLELDFVGVCWDGDLARDRHSQGWISRKFSGDKWQTVASLDRQRFIKNSYRVLLTRAREGLVIWIPRGSEEDPTRNPSVYNSTAEFLVECGAKLEPV